MAPRKIIIDTDPGSDDILALLLALSSSPSELEVLLISLTFGNIDLQNVLRNCVAMFHVLELEKEWRIANGKVPGFGSLGACKPVVAVGAEQPLEDEELLADYFHGVDGLGGVHTKAPHLTPTTGWEHLFDANAPLDNPPSEPHHTYPMPKNFIPSTIPAHKEILRVLRENDPGTITIVAVGPLTNLAMAAEEDVETFLKVKEVVVMGGVIDMEGNVTPVAEFNHYACPFSAARIYALTSPYPPSVLPPLPNRQPSTSRPLYQFPLPRPPLNLTLFPLDITTMHLLSQPYTRSVLSPLKTAGSPLAEWVDVFLSAAFQKMEELHVEVADPDFHTLSNPSLATPTTKKRIQDVDLSLHDPMCIWYMLTHPSLSTTTTSPGWKLSPPTDIRVEPTGQWTRGMNIVDRRTRRMLEKDKPAPLLGDIDIWLHKGYGNRVVRVMGSPGEDVLGREMLERIFGC